MAARVKIPTPSENLTLLNLSIFAHNVNFSFFPLYLLQNSHFTGFTGIWSVTLSTSIQFEKNFLEFCGFRLSSESQADSMMLRSGLCRARTICYATSVASLDAFRCLTALNCLNKLKCLHIAARNALVPTSLLHFSFFAVSYLEWLFCVCNDLGELFNYKKIYIRIALG